MIIERLKSGVITVGQGRGFVVEGAGERLVITAAHCLPSLPSALASFGLAARTYGPLLARRGEEPRTWAACRFVDPIADIAVLGSPDNPHADDYNALMATATALTFGDSVRHPVNFWLPARLLSLDDRWFSCTIRHYGGPLWITLAVVAALGAALAAAYFLRLLRRVTHGPATPTVARLAPAGLAGAELVSWGPLILLALALGMLPALVLDLSAGAAQALAGVVAR